MNYIPSNESERKEMLAKVGVRSAAELFDVIPAKARIDGLKIGPGMSEQALVKSFEALARKNRSLKELSSFRGGGIYEHFVPAAVGEVIGRSEFWTAYTPYQAEASQGTLQAIFEYQSLIAELTGMDVANASMYDGASATAEAALMAMRATGRKKILISAAVHPEYRQVTATYLQGSDCAIAEIPFENGVTTVPDIDGETAAVIVQSPNFLGSAEDLSAFKAKAAAAGALLVTVVNPLSLGLFMPPGEAGADIAVGEGQVLGNPAGFGGFTFGFFAVKKALAWKIPGRVTGQTVDRDGKRGFVLTLQSREQHIRREKATSNICTNAALNALAGCAYLAGWGPDGFRALAETNRAKSVYAFEKICKVPGFAPAFKDQVFFNEFAIKTTRDIKALQARLLDQNILGPLEAGDSYPSMKDVLIFCVTETKSKQEIDHLVEVLK